MVVDGKSGPNKLDLVEMLGEISVLWDLICLYKHGIGYKPWNRVFIRGALSAGVYYSPCMNEKFGSIILIAPGYTCKVPYMVLKPSTIRFHTIYQVIHDL
jgi:hypothetical protein